MRKPPRTKVKAIALGHRLDRPQALVCLSLVLALLTLAARIASLW